MADYRKLDAGLAAALDGGAAGPLSVFIHLDRDAGDELQAFGVPAGSSQGGIATATLTTEQVGELSEQPWVLQIRSSTPLRLLGGVRERRRRTQ